jgi:hypothetical protein
MATRKKIPPTQWNLICDRIHNGFCVPFLGSAVNASKEPEYEGLELAPGVVKKLLEELLGRKIGSLDDIAAVHADEDFEQEFADLCRPGLHNLARVALYVEFRADPDYLRGLLQTICLTRSVSPRPFFESLRGCRCVSS